MRRLRILNVIEEGRYGGPQKRIVDVAVRLRAQHGIDTTVLLPARQSERFQQALTHAGVPFHAIRLHRLTRDARHLLGYVVFFVPEVVRIWRLIRRLGPDVVHCNGSYQLKGMIAASLAGATRVWHMNDTSMPGAVTLLFAIVRRLFSSGQFIFASERTGAYYFPPDARARPAGVWLIPAPVDTAWFSPGHEPENPYPDPDFTGVRVLAVGNVNPTKNHELLVRIAAELNSGASGRPVRYYVAGEILDNHRAYHRGLLAAAERLGVDNLVFLGGRTDVRALLQHADLVVCTSTNEASPIFVWEAMAMARPVVSTDVGDVKAVFESWRCGLIGPHDNVRELAGLVLRLIGSPDERAEMGRRGRAAAVELFDVDRCAAKHGACYRELTLSNEAYVPR